MRILIVSQILVKALTLIFDMYFFQESPLGLLLKERRLQAELEVWKKQRPSGEVLNVPDI